MLREHVNRAHRKGKSEEIDDLEGSNMRFTREFSLGPKTLEISRYRCEFPGCEREYGKKQHLKEHFRKHTGRVVFTKLKQLKGYGLLIKKKVVRLYECI